MARISVQIPENHITCDKCGVESADIIGHSKMKMNDLIKELRRLGSSIGKKDLCDKCKMQ